MYKISFKRLNLILSVIIWHNLALADLSLEKSVSVSVEKEKEKFCIISASEFHKVNSNILWAILKVESNFNADAINHNKNGTSDYGISGINSIHFKELNLHGINKVNIKEKCVGTYVAAWLLRRNMEKYGNTWVGVSSYHSVTPYFNERYQVLLRNALKEAGILKGLLEIVPPINKK